MLEFLILMSVIYGIVAVWLIAAALAVGFIWLIVWLTRAVIRTPRGGERW
jgi:hypothetical protein